jgi:uncharacterized protein (TIGR01627 family)
MNGLRGVLSRLTRPQPRQSDRSPREVNAARTGFWPRLRHLRKSAQKKIDQWRGKPEKNKAVVRAPKAKLRAPEPPQNVGPVAVLSHVPPVFKTGIAFDAFLGIASAFGARYGNRPAGFIIYPTWSIENPSRIARIAAAASAHNAEFSEHRLHFICNTALEAELLKSSGRSATYLNKNFTVSDRIFRPLSHSNVEFDAIYNARFLPEKRHKLAAQIDRVAYLGYIDPLSASVDSQRKLMADTLTACPSHTLINPLDDGQPVRISPSETNAALNRAAVGLCLSEVEGSNYASMEYMLAGMPVVSTPSKGGREVYFDPEYCIVCAPDPVAVREAVEALKRRNIPADYIRARTLARIEPERRRFQALLDEMLLELGGKPRFDSAWPFGAVSGMVVWNTFENHLLDFDRRSAISAIAETTGIGTDTLAFELERIQLTSTELAPIVKAVTATPGCSLLVFGCGNDSAFWERVNRNGTTAFLEDDPAWAELVRPQLGNAEVHLVRYDTKQSDWAMLINAPAKLDLELPVGISSRRWDVIVVDGPAGHSDNLPGRMKSIFAASRLVAPRGKVFVHDCDRTVEREYAARYLGEDRLFVQVRGRSVLNGYGF